MEESQNDKPEAEEKEARYIIDSEERHEIVYQFVSDIMKGFRKANIHPVDKEWEDSIRLRFAIVAGSQPSTADERANAELGLYSDIVDLSMLGFIDGEAGGVKQKLSEEIAALRERIEKTNGALLSMSKRIGEQVEDMDKRLKQNGI